MIPSTLVIALSSFNIVSCYAFNTIDTRFNKRYSTNRIDLKKYKVLQSTTEKSSWAITDDWSNLSSKATDKDHDLSNLKAFVNDVESVEDVLKEELNQQDQFISDTIDHILNHNGDPTDPQLYDTLQSMDRKKLEDESEQGMNEIAMMIRCNKSPDDLLMREGRALGPLEDDEKFDLQQLAIKRDVETEDKGTFPDASTIILVQNESYEVSSFFNKAVYNIFFMYAEESNKEDGFVLKSTAVAKWLGTCLNESIGKHDRQVLSLISKYGTYGEGYLTKANFHNMYVDALKRSLNESFAEIDTTARNIWRDFYNHGILSPSHEMHRALEKDMEKQINAIKDINGNSSSSSSLFMADDEFVDECEILDWGISSDDNKKELKSSYELVEMASDNKTPKRIRDGNFVFVDEETCIGCAQCVQIAPTSYTMLENGRARAFVQSDSPEVATAVSVCPVNCIHNIAFHELKELESGRDQGDGHMHHKHMGRRQGHTPLYVAGIDSDANHKSSWYHHIKQKCCLSGMCPTRGCFDCPRYSKPGDNPFFKELQKNAQHARKVDLALNSWEVQIRRKFADV